MWLAGQQGRNHSASHVSESPRVAPLVAALDVAESWGQSPPSPAVCSHCLLLSYDGLRTVSALFISFFPSSVNTGFST